MADVYLNAAGPLSFHAFVRYCQRLKTDDTVYPSKSGKFVFRDMYDVIICGPKEEATVRYPRCVELRHWGVQGLNQAVVLRGDVTYRKENERCWISVTQLKMDLKKGEIFGVVVKVIQIAFSEVIYPLNTA